MGGFLRQARVGGGGCGGEYKKVEVELRLVDFDAQVSLEFQALESTFCEVLHTQNPSNTKRHMY